MKRQKSFDNTQATLYLVATPIGNLEEMTPRAIKTLQEVDIIAAEDTRQTGKLLAHFDIHTKMITHHLHNEKESVKGILALLDDGKNVALVSDAGYPLISDPGSWLVTQVTHAGYNVVPVSGGNAVLNALVASGLDTRHFVFVGFLSTKLNERQRHLQRLAQYPETLIFYEAPHRVEKTLAHMLEVLGDRPMCLAREMTKLHEEFIRGSIKEVLEQCKGIKGEIVLVVAGASETEPDYAIEDIRILVEQQIALGCSKSEAIKIISKKLNISKNQIYQELHEQC